MSVVLDKTFIAKIWALKRSDRKQIMIFQTVWYCGYNMFWLDVWVCASKYMKPSITIHYLFKTNNISWVQSNWRNQCFRPMKCELFMWDVQEKPFENIQRMSEQVELFRVILTNKTLFQSDWNMSEMLKVVCGVTTGGGTCQRDVTPEGQPGLFEKMMPRVWTNAYWESLKYVPAAVLPDKLESVKSSLISLPVEWYPLDGRCIPGSLLWGHGVWSGGHERIWIESPNQMNPC